MPNGLDLWMDECSGNGVPRAVLAGQETIGSTRGGPSRTGADARPTGAGACLLPRACRRDPCRMTSILDWSPVDQRAVDLIRVLAMDAVQEAGSGHPGTAMSLAPAA